jgi:hypothetical protein
MEFLNGHVMSIQRIFMIKVITRQGFTEEWHDTAEGIAKSNLNKSNTRFGFTRTFKSIPKPANFKRGPCNVYSESFYD